MKSFLLAVFLLLLLSYWSHLLVSRQIESNVPVTVTIDDTPRINGICECRCCVLNGAMCEPVIRQEFTYNDGFYCQLCTDEFCRKNNSLSRQCHWMSTMLAKCFHYEHQHASPPSSASSSSSPFVSIRPILQ